MRAFLRGPVIIHPKKCQEVTLKGSRPLCPLSSWRAFFMRTRTGSPEGGWPSVLPGSPAPRAGAAGQSSVRVFGLLLWSCVRSFFIWGINPLSGICFAILSPVSQVAFSFPRWFPLLSSNYFSLMSSPLLIFAFVAFALASDQKNKWINHHQGLHHGLLRLCFHFHCIEISVPFGLTDYTVYPWIPGSPGSICSMFCVLIPFSLPYCYPHISHRTARCGNSGRSKGWVLLKSKHLHVGDNLKILRPSWRHWRPRPFLFT